MKKVLIVSLVAFLMLFITPSASSAQGKHEAGAERISELRERITHIENQLATLEGLRAELQSLREQLTQLEAQVTPSPEALAAEHPPRPRIAPTVAERIEALEEKIGIGIGAQLQASIQGIVDDGKAPELAPEGRTVDGQASYDLVLEVELGTLGEAYIQAEGGDGLGLTEELDTNLSPNGDVGPTSDASFAVTEAWVELGLAESPLVFTVGKVDLTNYFDQSAAAGDEVTQFLGSAFVNSPAIEFPTGNGLGGRLTWRAVPEFLIFQIGAGEGDADFEDLFEDGFAMGEVELVLKPFGQIGHYRAGGWLNSGEHTELDNPSNTDRRAFGVSASLDQKLNDFITLFGRFSYQDLETFDFPYFWSGGMEIQGGPWGRSDDAVGVGFAQLVRNTRRPVAAEDPRALTNEGMLETYYRLYVNPHLAFGPHIQIIFDPAGVEEADEVILVGGRLVVGF